MNAVAAIVFVWTALFCSFGAFISLLSLLAKESAAGKRSISHTPKTVRFLALVAMLIGVAHSVYSIALYAGAVLHGNWNDAPI